MLSIAVIGAGRIGSIHARNIAAHAGVRLAGVADVNAAAAERAGRAQCGAQVAVAAIEAFADVDAVLIASPTRHACRPASSAPPRAGKAIFCEKPIDLDADGSTPAWPGRAAPACR